MPKRQKSRGIFGQLFNKSNVPNLEAPENSMSAPSDDVPVQPETMKTLNISTHFFCQQRRILKDRRLSRR